MSLFSFKKKNFLSLVFDIRDSSITIAAAKFESGQKPEMVQCQNFKIEEKNTSDANKYTSGMLKALNDGILSIRKNLVKTGNKEDINKYFFFLDSPWSVSQAKLVKIIKDRPFEVNKNLLDKIVSGEELGVGKELASSGQSRFKVLEEKIIQFKLNGYKLENVMNKKANDLEVELFVSFVPEKISQAINEPHNKDEKSVKRQFNSSVLSSYNFFRDLYTNKNNFLYIDISDYLTEIFVVRDDVIEGIVSFPFGEKDIIQKICEKMKISEDMAISYVNMNCRGECDEKTEKSIRELVGVGMKIWFEKLDPSITKICPESNVPKDVFIVENSNLTKTVINEMKNIDSLNILGRKVFINPILEGSMNNYISNGKAFKNEPYVKMDMIFIKKTMDQ